jgi:septal ring factor EnvC (AmiA/AmiB activator)
LLLLAVIGPVAWAVDEGSGSGRAAELKKLRSSIETLRKELGEVRGQHDDLRSELRSTEDEIVTLKQQLEERDASLRVQADKVAALQRNKQTQQDNLAAQQRALAGQVRAAYLIGRQDYLKILLNQEDPARLGRTLVYYDFFNRKRTQYIRTLAADVSQIESLEQAIKHRLAGITRLQAIQNEQKQVLERSQQTRKKVLAKLDSDIRSKERNLQRVVEDEERLRTLLPKLQDALSGIAAEPGVDRSSFKLLKGKLPWPAQGPLLVSYGSSRMAGAMKWQGVLIGADAGQDVKAISHGRVAFADWLRGFGLLIIVDHGDGYMSLYGHNQSLHKRAADWVEAGEVIASVGDTGERDQPGLYFEIRHQGNPANPVLWCKKE